MCLTFFCSSPSQNSQVKIVLGFNRQEQTLRQTLKFNYFLEDQNIFGGRDIKSGGTWFGMNIKTGIIVFLTNFDLIPPAIRLGRSRGKLVYKFLSTSFMPSQFEDNFQKLDQLIFSELKQIMLEGIEYSPFNLTVCNLRSGKQFYICSEWNGRQPQILNKNECYGLSNADIFTVWPKIAHGMPKFKEIINSLSEFSSKKIFQQLHEILKDSKQFSLNDQDQSAIFVKPYWNIVEKAERMTKTSLILLVLENEGKKEIIVREITYGRQGEEEFVDFKFIL